MDLRNQKSQNPFQRNSSKAGYKTVEKRNRVSRTHTLESVILLSRSTNKRNAKELLIKTSRIKSQEGRSPSSSAEFKENLEQSVAIAGASKFRSGVVEMRVRLGNSEINGQSEGQGNRLDQKHRLRFGSRSRARRTFDSQNFASKINRISQFVIFETESQKNRKSSPFSARKSQNGNLLIESKRGSENGKYAVNAVSKVNKSKSEILKGDDFSESNQSEINSERLLTENKNNKICKIYKHRRAQKSNNKLRIRDRLVFLRKDHDLLQMSLTWAEEKAKIKKSRKIKKKVYYDYLAGSLNELTYNKKIRKLFQLRRFYAKMRAEFFKPKQAISKTMIFSPQNENGILNKKIILKSGNGNQKMNLIREPIQRKIRRIPESPAKVLDSPGINNDFYTHTLDVSKKGNLAIALNSIVYSFNLETNATQKIKTSFKNTPTCVKMNFSGEMVAVGDCKGNLNLIDLKKNCYLIKSKMHKGRIGVAKFLDDNVLITGGKDSHLKLIDIREKQRKESKS